MFLVVTSVKDVFKLPKCDDLLGCIGSRLLPSERLNTSPSVHAKQGLNFLGVEIV